MISYPQKVDILNEFLSGIKNIFALPRTKFFY